MRVIQVYGFGDTPILITHALNRLGIETDMVVTNKQFAGQLPAWTKDYDITKHIYVHRTEDAIDPMTVVNLTKFINSYDFAIIHQPAGMYGDMIKIPYAVWDGGSGRFLFDQAKHVKRPEVEADKAAARRTYKKAKVILANDIDVLYKLFMPRKFKQARYVPLPVDCDLFLPLKIPHDKFRIYLPSRQNNAIKGTNDMLAGVSQFIHHPSFPMDDRNAFQDNIQVHMPLFGADSVMIPRALRDHRIDGYTNIVPLYPKPQFAQALQGSDVVIEQLLIGGYGGVAAQAMACGKPVIVNAWRPWYREQLDDEPPILFAKSAFDVAAQLEHVYDDLYLRDYWHIAKSARTYAVRHHHHMRVGERIKELIE